MLFNKSSNGASEMKSLLGFIYATKSFENMITDIELASDELISILGAEFYREIESFYHSGGYDNPGNDPVKIVWKELVHRVQLPIAFYAYRSFAAHGDLTHSDKGRQILVSEFEKPAFEWMIMRDDHSMLMKAHKLTDRLLQFLDENKTDEKILAKWINTEVYKASKDNLISSAAAFDAIFPIHQSRRFYLKVLPFIREVERTRLIPVLTRETYEGLIAFIRYPNASDNPLLNYTRIPLVMYTMAIAARRLAVEILPDGVFQNYISGTQSARAKNPVEMEFKTEVAQLLDKQGDHALSALQQYLAKMAAQNAGTCFSQESLTERHSSENQFFRA